MGGNNRDFGSLEFRRLLKRFILSGGHKIPLLPGSPIELADKDDSLITAKIFDEPIGVTDELWDETTEAPVYKVKIDKIDASNTDPIGDPDDFLFDEIDQDVEMHIIGEPIPIHDPDEPIDDFLFDEIAPDVRLHITAEEGFNYYAGQRFVPSIGRPGSY